MVTPGYGLSDVALIIGIAERIYTTFKDSPGQFQDLSREVTTFKSRISEFRQRFPNEQNGNCETQSGRLILESKEVLKKLDAHLENFKSLATDKKSPSDRLLFGRGDTRKLRERLRNLGSSIQGLQIEILLQQNDNIGAQIAQILNELVKDKFDNKPIESTLWNDLFNEIYVALERREISMHDIKRNTNLIIDAIAERVEKQKNTLPNNASATQLRDYQESDQLGNAAVREHQLEYEDTSASSSYPQDPANLSDTESTPGKTANEEAHPKAPILRGPPKRTSLCTVGSSSIAHDGLPPDPPPAFIRDKTALFDKGVFRPPRNSADEDSGPRKTSPSSFGEADLQTLTTTATQSSSASRDTSSSASSQEGSKGSVAGLIAKIGESSWSMTEKIEETG